MKHLVSLPLHPEFLSHPPEGRYLLGISGGRDSVALFHRLRQSGYKNLVLCHLNHGLRGEASEEDAAFVKHLGKRYGLPVEIKLADVTSRMQEKGESMELAARNARHDFFSECAEKHNTQDVLLAHHSDDQVETILFNLMRGSGGLRGMCFESRLGNLRLLRPLLLVTRNDITEYLARGGFDYREDASNNDPIATRNRIRNEAIPLLNEIMGREIRPAIIRAAEVSQSQHDALKNSLKNHQLEDPQGRLFLPLLLTLPPALQRIALQDYLKKHQIPDITHDLLGRGLSMLKNNNPAKINLPGGKFLRRKEKRLFVSSTHSTDPPHH